jgi:DNA-directed RNA polymerase subunit E'/Rpb7
MDESLFVRVIVKDNIKVSSARIGDGVLDAITQRLKQKYEGVCSRHGYIRAGSIDVLKFSLGKVEMDTLNGDVTYVVQYSADVANPTIGSVVKATIKNMNKFGIRAESDVRLPDGTYVSVLDVLIARQTLGIASEIDLDQVKINDKVYVEVLAKKFELGGKTISVVGRIISNDAAPGAVAAPADEEFEQEDVEDAVESDPELVSSDHEEEADEEEEPENEDEDAFSEDIIENADDFFEGSDVAEDSDADDA